MTRSLRRGALGVALFVAALAAVPSGTASAHAALESSTPAANSVLETGPSSIVLDFDEEIEVGLASIKLFAGDGSAVELGSPSDGADATAVTVSVPTLTNDIYAVIWKVTSADGHAVEGAFSFQVGTGTTGNAQDLLDQVKGGGAATSGLVWFYAIARFLALTGAIVLIGVGLWSLTGRPAIGTRPGVQRLMWVGWAMLQLGAIGAFLGFSAQATGGTMADVFTLSSRSDIVATQTGRMLALRMLLALVLGIVLWRRSASGTSWWRGTAAIAAVLTLVTFSASGHPNSLSPKLLWVTIDELHLVAIVVWLGGLLALWFAGRQWMSEPEAVRPVERFSLAASICVPVIVVTGVLQTLKLAGSLTDVSATDWGRMLLTKVMLVIAMVGVGAVSRWLLQHDGAGSIRRTVVVEAIIGVLVVALAAGIVGQPPRVGTPSKLYTETLTANGVIADVSITPGQVGSNEIHIVVTPPGGSINPVAGVTARVSLPAQNLPFSPVTVTNEGPNHFSGQVTFPRAGDWTLEVVVQVTDSDSALLKATVTIP